MHGGLLGNTDCGCENTLEAGKFQIPRPRATAAGDLQWGNLPVRISLYRTLELRIICRRMFGIGGRALFTNSSQSIPRPTVRVR